MKGDIYYTSSDKTPAEPSHPPGGFLAFANNYKFIADEISIDSKTQVII